MRYIVLITQLKKKIYLDQYIIHWKSHSSSAISTSSTHLQISGFTLLKGRNSCQVMFFFIMMAVKCMYMWQIDMQSFICKNLVFFPEFLNFSHHTPLPFSFSFLSETNCSCHRIQIDLCQRNLDQWMLEFPYKIKQWFTHSAESYSNTLL